MDVKEQLQRLLDLTERTRQHAAELDVYQSEAQSYIDTAEYDLRRLIIELRDVLDLTQPAADELPTPALPNVANG
ncbi:MAG: hypothetical protein ACKVP3_05280 [Hyphomicrobiaceae bacterium]